MFAHVARYCRGRVDWAPHLERVLAGLLRAILIPSGRVTIAAAANASVKSCEVEEYAQLLANAIGPASPCPVLDCLEKFYEVLTVTPPPFLLLQADRPPVGGGLGRYLIMGLFVLAV